MSTASLRRVGSLCAPDPHLQLLSALLEKDLQRFQALLQRAELDPDHWYGDPHHATCLELACTEHDGAGFVDALLAAGADPSRANPVRKTRPIHVAAGAGNVAALAALVASPGVDVNDIDNLGNTALHVCAKGAQEECVSVLLDCPSYQVNLLNRKGLSALHLAALHGSEDLVRTMLQSTRHHFNLNGNKTSSGKTTRDVILEKFPNLEYVLPAPVSPNNAITATVLFHCLYYNDCSSFVEGLQSMRDSLRGEVLSSNDGNYTLLQLACERGLTEAVKLLLDIGADPHAATEFNPRPPAVIAAYHGYYHILEWFVFYRVSRLASSSDGETVLHAAVLGARCNVPLRGSDDRDHEKCLRLLLSHVQDFGIDVNQQDAKGNTALHYAASQDDKSSVLALLRRGANIGVRNSFKDPPLASIDADTLECFLGECLETNGELPREENFEVIIKYNFLSPPSKMSDKNNASKNNRRFEMEEDVNITPSNIPETDPLLYISRSRDLKDLLKHPVFTSFLYLKWLRMRRYYYMNLALYGTYVFLLTVYVLFVYSKSNSSVWFRKLTWIFLFIFYLWFIGRELFQFVLFLKKYVTSPENYLEISLIIVTGIILFSPSHETEIVQPLSAISILLSWTELVLLIGRHPKLSTNIEMLKRVTWNFLKFLSWYSILVVAFALSFYTLFHDCQSSVACQAEENFFTGPGTSVFKTIVMLTGEFDAGSIPFVTFPGTSHVVFVLFIFLIAIVLFNLLNALAVCDTQAIKNDAELVGLVSRVNLVFHFESIILGNTMEFLDQLSCCQCLRSSCRSFRFKKLFADVCLFPDALPEKAIRVLPNQNSRVVFSLDKCRAQKFPHGCCRGCQECGACYMDKDILRAAMDHISGRRKPSLKDIWDLLGKGQCKMEKFQDQIKESNRKLEDYGPRFDDIDRSWKHTEEKMDLIIEWLRTVNNNNFSRRDSKTTISECSTQTSCE
ncbi:hypothetical protein PR048_027375 [Dryococelus australis]|uniref:Ion transport domain-containing protein n=1 Tax=Dryococelus australis TaxID=614101 RepID=A0ABQ9GFA6_9NEOP|nr:hypothetical protein PR048_027375 [Dryococelus australis]